MPALAAGAFRRTPLERSDDRISWARADQAFFASGACHVLAWVCRDLYPGRPVGLAAVRVAGDQQVIHTYATWGGWAFDHAGWNAESDLLAANAAFEGRELERIELTSTLAEFCKRHDHRMPDQYWNDPLPRAREYVGRYLPPWVTGAGA